MPQDVVQALQEACKAARAASCIHTLGFSHEHDASFLSTLTRAGTHEGTFHYVRGANDMHSALGSVAQLMLSTCFVPPLQLLMPDGTELARIVLTEESQEPEDPIKASVRKFLGVPAKVKPQMLSGRGHVAQLPTGLSFLEGKVGAAFIAIVVTNVTNYSLAWLCMP